MIKLGTHTIGKIYLGNHVIGKAYLGSNLVYDSGNSPGPGPGPTPVPYDSEVEYLESSGAQYIDTGYIPTPSTTVVLDAALVASQVNVNLVGLYREFGTPQRFHISTYQSQWNYGVSNSSATNKWVNFTGGINTQRHTFEIRGDGYCAVDSTTKQIAVSNNDSYTQSLYVFARNCYEEGADQFSRMQLYGLQISESGVLVHDYVTVRVGQVGYLYDRISGSLLGNSGTGSFTLGSDIE